VTFGRGYFVSEEARESTAVPPEVRLFRHIILNAVLDAIYGSCLTNENSDRIRAEAWRWFAQAGSDFRSICELAEMQPETVRANALRYIQEERETLPIKARRPRLSAMSQPRRMAA
jgi:hypothetical protein